MTALASRSTAVNRTMTAVGRSARTEADEFGAFARRVLRAYARRVADRDVEALAGLAALRDEVDAAIATAVAGLHGNPYSWTDIGRALGTTRQAAQLRFGRRAKNLAKELSSSGHVPVSMAR